MNDQDTKDTSESVVKWCEDLLDQFVEEGAALEHQRWAHWQEYMFSKCTKNDDGTMTIPKWAVERWSRQMNTKYTNLSMGEKNSDIIESEKYIPILKRILNIVRGRYLVSQYTKAQEDLKDVLKDAEVNSPYPKDVFTEPTKSDYKKMQTIFKEAGMEPDKFFGSAMRSAWYQCIVRIEHEFNEIYASRIMSIQKK